MRCRRAGCAGREGEDDGGGDDDNDEDDPSEGEFEDEDEDEEDDKDDEGHGAGDEDGRGAREAAVIYRLCLYGRQVRTPLLSWQLRSLSGVTTKARAMSDEAGVTTKLISNSRGCFSGCRK